jgi:hypothetical protein
MVIIFLSMCLPYAHGSQPELKHIGNIRLMAQSNDNVSRVPMWYDEGTRVEISCGPIVKCHVYTVSRVF